MPTILLRIPIVALLLALGCRDPDPDGSASTESEGSDDDTGPGPGGDDSTDDSDDGDPDDGSSDDDTGDPIDDCEGIELTVDGSLDVDLRAVKLQGRVTLVGEPLPAAPHSRGTIVFQHRAHGSALSISLRDAGDFEYAVTLPPGSYDVRYVADPGACLELQSPFPCVGGLLTAGVNVQADGVLDLDLRPVRITGKLTRNGAAMSNSPTPGTLGFSAGPDTGSVPLQGPDSDEYAVTVLRGTYDVAYEGSPSGCDGRSTAARPCNRGVVVKGVEITTSGVLDVDVPTVDVSGIVTVDGRPMAAEADQRGSLSFVDAGGSAFEVRRFEQQGSVAYATTLVAGEYAIAFDANESLCGYADAPSVPCTGGRLRDAVDLSRSGVLDVDIPTVLVGGRVLLEGEALPDQARYRGAIAFVGADDSVATASAGSDAYELRVLPGAYRVDFLGDPAACDGLDTPPVPCNSGTIVEQVELASDGALDIDVPAVRISGRLTVDGNPAGAMVGRLGFGGDDRPPWAVDVFDGELRMTVLPGTYDVDFVPDPYACEAEEASEFPCAGGRIASQLELRADGALDLDVPTVQVAVGVTLAGEVLPDELDERGTLVFAPIDGTTAYARWLEAFGDASFQLRLVPGRYVVSHEANPDLCQIGDGPPRVPCASARLLGCTNLARD